MPACKRNAFTLIEFLIALVIIGFIVAILVGVFSSPVKQARTDSAVTQTKDALRQISDAISLAAARGGRCCSLNDLVADGYLTSKPALAGPVSTADGYQRESEAAYAIGGCGTNTGAPVTVQASLANVPLEFCNEYNAAQGLAATFVENCRDTPGNCASGSADGTAPVDPGVQSFCFHDGGGMYAIRYNTGVPGSADSSTPGVDACP